MLIKNQNCTLLAVHFIDCSAAQLSLLVKGCLLPMESRRYLPFLCTNSSNILF